MAETREADINRAITMLDGAIRWAELRSRMSGYKTDDMGVDRKKPKKVELSQDDARFVLAAILSATPPVSEPKGE